MTTPPSTGGRIPTLTRQQAKAASCVLFAAFVGLMVLLGWIAWNVPSLDLSSLTKNLSVVVAALFGAVINPKKDSALAKRGLVTGWAWVALTVVGLFGAIATGGALCWHGNQPNSVPALTAAVAAFAGLFVDTTGLTHSD
ncbi:hypothetical protein ACIPSA_43185 [Streptomyces sp. NPDC086549]|uniref:hypothetical protein n=1 Tax=Streptomyces sp. NPDC086549 TaxID=3365752 RepID=UPI0038185D22